jgi:hypothetical protein
MSMAKYRKKPIVIEAWRWMFSEDQDEPPVWLSDATHEWPKAGCIAFWPDGTSERPEPHMAIKTLEGEMVASQGDWIIKGVQGELYPCKPEIFEATYELVVPDDDWYRPG